MKKEKYKIGEVLFSTKKEIKEYTTKMVEHWFYNKQPLSQESKLFLFDLIKNHPNIAEYNYKALSVGLDVEYQTTICLKLKLENDDFVDFSYVKCIDNLSQSDIVKIPKKKIVLEKNTNKFYFGKYKGKTFEWVWENDSDYIEWILNKFKDDDSIIVKLKTYLESIGVVIQEKDDEEEEINYTQEDLDEAIKVENYELAALISKTLKQQQDKDDDLPF